MLTGDESITGESFRTLVLPAFLRGIILGFSKIVELPFGSYKTVAALLTLVNYTNVTGVRIGECVEGVTYKIHLQNSFFGSHRLEGESLDSYLKLTLFNILIVVILRNNEGVGLYTLLKSGLILSDLSFKALDCSVKSCNEGIALLFTSEGRTSVIYGNFDYLHPFTNLAGHEGFRILTKKFVEFQKLLFYCRLK